MTPFSDSDVVEEAETASEAWNESDEDDVGGNVQSHGPCVPITPHRRVVNDDEDEAELTCTESHRENLFIFSKVQTHSVPIRLRSTNRRKREAPPSKHGLPIPAQEGSSSSRVLAPQQKKRSQVASWIRQRNAL